jgi:hypothetical protein
MKIPLPRNTTKGERDPHAHQNQDSGICRNAKHAQRREKETAACSLHLAGKMLKNIHEPTHKVITDDWNSRVSPAIGCAERGKL